MIANKVENSMTNVLLNTCVGKTPRNGSRTAALVSYTQLTKSLLPLAPNSFRINRSPKISSANPNAA